MQKSSYFILMFAILTLAAAAPKLGDPVLGKMQKIKQWGYSIRPIDEWKSITPQPDEKHVVGKWQANLDEALKRGDMSILGGPPPELRIIRIPLGGSTTESSSDPEAAKEKEEREKEKEKITRAIGSKSWEMRLNPKSLDDWIEGNYEGASKRFVAKDVKAGKLTGQLVEFGHGAEMYCIGRFRRDNVDWGVVYSSFEEHYKKHWMAIYKKSIETFALFEAEGQPSVPTSATDVSKLPPDEKRKVIKAGIAGSPGWYAIDTTNYVFLSNSANRAGIQSLAREIELIRAKIYEKLFPPKKQITAVCTVRVLGTESEYYQYGGPRGSAGYWNDRTEELVLFEGFTGMTKKDSKAATKSVMYHEAFHQYIHYAVGDLAPHSWFNEGHGDYFAGMVVAGDSIRTTTFDWRVDYLRDHIRQKNDLIPIRSLVRLPQSEYYTNGGLKYSQGWALIYFLRSVTKDARWKQIPDIYFSYLSENIAAFRAKKKDKDEDDVAGESIPGIPGVKLVDFEDVEKVEQILSEAVDKAFEGVDYEALDKAYLSFVKSL